MNSSEIRLRFPAEERDFVFFAAPRTSLRLTHALLQRVLMVVCPALKQPEREAGHVFPYNVEIKNIRRNLRVI
jgi:hypothetical protein